MSNVIKFPSDRKDTIEKAMDYFKHIYLNAGLSDSQTSYALQELQPFVREAFPRKEFSFNLSGNLAFSSEQTEAITREHNRCMQEALSYFSEQMWLSLCKFAGIIGVHAQEKI